LEKQDETWIELIQDKSISAGFRDNVNGPSGFVNTRIFLEENINTCSSTPVHV